MARITAQLKTWNELWPAFTPNNPRPDCPQLLFWDSDAKHRCFNGGFGAGKTYVGAQQAWDTARRFPGSVGLVIAPSYPALRDYTQKTFFEQAGCGADTIEQHPLVARWNKNEQYLKLVNGSELYFRSAESLIIGFTVDWFWIDEPADCPSHTWKFCLGRLRGQTGPRRGWATGTPKGRNWVWREFAEHDRPGYVLFTGSSLDNERTPEDYKDGLVESYTGAFARANIFGEFAEFEGQVYAFNRKTHVLDEDWTPEPQIAFDRTADFGTNNPTAWLWIQEIAGTVYVFDELEVRRQPVDVIAAEVKSRWTELRHGGDFGDIAGTQRDSNLESYVSNYARAGIPIHSRSGGAVKAGVEVVTRYLVPPVMHLVGPQPANPDTPIQRPRLFIHPRCTRLMAAFETYRWPEDKDGKAIADEPVKDGESDHLMDALRYWFVNRHPEQFVRPSAPAAAGSYKPQERNAHGESSTESPAQPGRGRRSPAAGRRGYFGVG